MTGRARQAQSPAKLMLMATSIAFWWYSNVAVSNMLVGIALFEIFHDVQYLTIVWIFNLNRADRNPSVGRFTRFLFRRSWGLAGLYVGSGRRVRIVESRPAGALESDAQSER